MHRKSEAMGRNEKVKAALYSLFIGDALSMPVHWYYRTSDIVSAFPPHGITKMESAPAEHPSSIMSLHSTQAGGRKASVTGRAINQAAANNSSSSHGERYNGEIVGDVILKGKRKLWGGSHVHYHHGMQAGDNTLNACCARLMLRHLVQNNGYNKRRWLEDYIAFMTAEPAMHPDTYAESYHRGFFANLQKGMAADECGAQTHDTPSMGALVTVAPLAIALLSAHPVERVQEACCTHVRLTHPDDGLLKVVTRYVSLINDLLLAQQQAADNRTDKADQFIQAAKIIPGAKLEKYLNNKVGDMSVVGGQYSTACYITDSWPSVCYLAAKYYATPGKALLINTNLGGENAHRGSVLGSMVGLVNGKYDKSLYDQLLHRDAISQEVQGFINRFC